MATENFSVALRAPASSSAHPMAAPGYGKRSVPEQTPRRADDFLLLPERERYIAAFVDRLPEGAAMTVKTLAKLLPRYGQQAVSTALTALSVAGHLRRVRCPAGAGEQVRWVFRTFWSRTARDNEWWAAFLADESGPPAARISVPVASVAPDWVPAEEPAPVVPVDERPQGAPPSSVRAPAAAQEPGRPRPVSDGYLVLAELGCVDARLALSAADCVELEELALEWLARGVTPAYIVQVLTAGLPAEHINSAVGFIRHRLTKKMPPYRPVIATPVVPGAPARRVMMECTRCGVPGFPEALPDGLCRECRPALPGTEATPDEGGVAVAVREVVRERVEALRALARNP